MFGHKEDSLNSNFVITSVNISETGKVFCNLGYSSDQDNAVYEAEIQSFAGFISIPANPTNKDFCSAVINYNNGYPQILSTSDNRNRDVIKTINPGETAVYAINSSCIIRLKTDRIDIEFDNGNKIEVKSNEINITGGNINLSGITSINNGEPLVKMAQNYVVAGGNLKSFDLDLAEKMSIIDKALIYMNYYVNELYSKYTADYYRDYGFKDWKPKTFDQFCDKSNIQVNEVVCEDWEKRGFASQSWVVLRPGSIYHYVFHKIK